jgi:hypothetical protein
VTCCGSLAVAASTVAPAAAACDCAYASCAAAVLCNAAAALTLWLAAACCLFSSCSCCRKLCSSNKTAYVYTHCVSNTLPLITLEQQLRLTVALTVHSSDGAHQDVMHRSNLHVLLHVLAHLCAISGAITCCSSNSSSRCCRCTVTECYSLHWICTSLRVDRLPLCCLSYLI